MRYFISILLVILSLSIRAQTTYYVDPSGTDGAGISGDVSHPWKTLAYACTRVSSGDDLHLNAGLFVETERSQLPTGVDVIGEGASTVITSVNALNPILRAYSATEGTNGSQSISYLSFDGDMVAISAIWVTARSNVTISNCTFKDFTDMGVIFQGKLSGDGIPSVYSENNKILNCTFNNCSGYTTWGKGTINFGGQKNFELGNTFAHQTQRADSYNGYVVKSYPGSGHNKGIWVHDCDFKVKNYVSVSGRSYVSICVELWNSHGGILFENNEISGALDVGGYFFNDDGGYGYALKIIGNHFYQDELRTWSEKGITFECDVTGGVWIERNWFDKIYNPVSINIYHLGDRYEYIYINYNLMTNIATAGSTNGKCLYLYGSSSGSYDNINFCNNTCEGAIGTSNFGIHLNLAGPLTNFTARNNIFYDFSYVLYSQKYSIDIMSFENNLSYLCGNANNPYYTNTVTNLTSLNNLKLNPLFVSSTDFSLQSISPAINMGLDLSLDYDIDSVSVPIGTYPDIGAYEYVVPSPAIDPTVVSTTRPYWTSPTTATSGGYVTDDGGGTVTARGVCWNTSGSPTIADSHTSNGSGTGAYTSFMTGLNDKLLYYVRAYATNETGTSYGAQLTFRSSQVIRNKEIVVMSGGKLIRIGN